MQEPITVRELTAAERPVAAHLLAAGMRDNPVHCDVFGPAAAEREAALTALFTGLLRFDRGHRVLGALDRARLVGVLAETSPRQCRLGPLRRAGIAGRLLPWGPRVLARAARWQSTWTSADPGDGHVHLGPLAVEVDRRSTGIGSALMARHLTGLDRLGVPGYLETDREQNVDWYRRFGYGVTGEVGLFGRTHWLMTRLPGGAAAP